MGKNSSMSWLSCFLAILFLVGNVGSSLVKEERDKNGVKTAVFLSPKFEMEPGSVSNKYFLDIDFPRGHIGIKSFMAEVVDEAGNSVPLDEIYLHHWIAVNYYERNDGDVQDAGNAGVCSELSQYFGLGSETRKTDTLIPDPYGIEIGNPGKIPAGYKEKWMLNVHAIDTVGAYDRLGCIECECDFYNVTADQGGNKLPPDYLGGLRCCYDNTRCRLRDGFRGAKKQGFYLKYTVKYVDWKSSIVPVKVYIFDVTDEWKKSQKNSTHHCLVEYDVKPCSHGDKKCVRNKKVSINLPDGGNLIYGVGHQHIGAISSTLYGKDGKVLCSSVPIYGKGKKPGNEAGYVVGMSTCYPKPGSVKILPGETLTVVSSYSSTHARGHTGVMGLFYILVADLD